MGSAIVALLVETAAKVGAPVVKRLLEKALPGESGGLAGSIVDAVAEALGVAPEKIASAPPGELDDAVRDVEERTPELIQAYVASQAEANKLMLAEMAKSETPFGWAWRPAMMWLIGFLWLWRLAIVPAVDAAAGTAMAGAIELSTMMWLTTVYCGLYMGGHTVKDFIAKWAGKPA